MNKSICVAQIEVVTGDIKGNVSKIVKCVENSTSDIILFGETVLTSYNCGQLFENDDFIKQAEDAIHEITKAIPFGKYVILGNIEKLDHLYNSAYVLTKDRIIGTTQKQHLCDDLHHLDSHFFKAGNKTRYFDLDGVKCGILICEDCWNMERDLYMELYKEHVDVVFSLNASYNSFNKKEIRREVFKSKEFFIPTIYCNNIGLGDEIKAVLSFEGSSMIIDKNKTFATLPRYKEMSLKVNFDPTTQEFSGTEYDKLIDYQIHYATSKDYEKYDNILDMSIYTIKNMFKLSGIKKALITMSGGLDSSIVGYLAVKALGKENCIFLSLPSKNNSEITKGNAQYEADKLGVDIKWISIQPYVDMYKKDNPNASKIEIATFEAVHRNTLALAQCHAYGASMISAMNHSELMLGFSSYNDVSFSGVCSVLGDLTKNECMKLAKFINLVEDDEIIVKGLYDGTIKVSAELEDSSEDPWDYGIMSEVCGEIIRNNNYNKSDICSVVMEKIAGDYPYEAISLVKEYIDDALRLKPRSAYKRFQAPPLIIMNDKGTYSTSSRETLINKWEG